MDTVERWRQILFGVLAGNIFDWGAKAVCDLLEAGTLDFQIALNKLKGNDSCKSKWVLLKQSVNSAEQNVAHTAVSFPPIYSCKCIPRI